MKRVLLVNPKMCGPASRRIPLSLLALAAGLEGKADVDLVDGNVDEDAVSTAVSLARIADLVGITVMPGPQVAPAIAVSKAIRSVRPEVPIAWGGYFPTLYAEAAINAPYVDFVVRAQGEETLAALAGRVPSREGVGIAGLTWKRGEEIVHEPDRPFRSPDTFPPYRYGLLREGMEPYLRPSLLGRRTAVHQAAIGCRYRCSFCGVASMFAGKTILQGPARLLAAATELRDRHGADALQLYDHNFFDREDSAEGLVAALEKAGLPWWCYARADALAGFPAKTWDAIRRSRLRMAYIGAEAASDAVLRTMHKGAKVEQTFEAVRLCRAHGVIPELSFVLGGPDDPEGELEATLDLVRSLKAIHPESEVILYVYSPTPQRDPARAVAERPGGHAVLPHLASYGPDGPSLPTTPEEWTEPRWIDYVCHRDAPWLTPRLRARIRDFATVLGCRFPTSQDVRTPAWGKGILRTLAAPRWASRRYGRPVELRLARKLIPLREPEREGL